jgi:hypothetical protein
MLRLMKKRVLAAFLWFYAFWYVGAMIAELAGLSTALGPILGTAAAAIIAGDPRGLIWRQRTADRSSKAVTIPAAGGQAA